MSWQLDPEAVKRVVDTWGLAILASAAILELVLVVQRKLAAKYGWRRWPTISMVFRDDGKVWLVFPFGWGLMGGHWWGPFPQFFGWDFYLWIATAVGLLTRDVANRWHPTPLRKRWVFAVLLLGVAEGAVFWSTGA